MPNTTPTITKGVPPRVHKPKASKPKAKPRGKQANATKPGRKRVASESESDGLEDTTELRAKKKQNTTHRRIGGFATRTASDSEVELVDNAVPPNGIAEIVDNETDGGEVSTEQEVSTSHITERDTHQHLGRP